MLKVLVSCFKLKHETYFSPILPAWKEVFTSQSHMSALQCKDKQYTTTATLTVHIIHKLLQTYQVSCLQRDSHTLQVILMLSQSDAQISCLFQRMSMPTLNHSLFYKCFIQGAIFHKARTEHDERRCSTKVQLVLSYKSLHAALEPPIQLLQLVYS